MISDLYVPLVTPFAADGSVDRDALSAHAAWLAGQGASGVMLFGTTGEGPSVSVTEKLETTRRLSEELPGLAIIGSVTESSVAEAASCVEGYNELPVVATLIQPPGYFREVETDGIRAFFERLVPQSQHPVLGYHIPSLAPGVPLDVVADLDMWGAKDSSGDLAYTRAVIAAGRGVMVGAEPVLPEALEAGAAGAIAGMGNLLPRHMALICSSFKEGDVDLARRLRDEVVVVQEAMRATAPGTEWVALMKQLAGLREGIDLGGVRLPLMARRDYRTPQMLAALDHAWDTLPALV